MEFNLEKFFFDTPLYESVFFKDEDEDFDSVFKDPAYSGSTRDVEGYNPWRKTSSTFQITRNLHYHLRNTNQSGYGEIILRCKRYGTEFHFYCYWNAGELSLKKIGQDPSVADFHIGEVKQYNKVIPTEKLGELTRAIGLAAHGIGIGSFVYLRRIFEYLINEAFEKAKSEQVIDEAAFKLARMDDKIMMLHSFLPPFLVEHRSMYSILSLGIHQLDEEACLTHFDALRVGIEIILDEKLEEQNKKDKYEQAKKKLATVPDALKNQESK